MTQSNAHTPRVSSGHKLGQIVGDWFEEHVAWPILREVATSLDLYPDSRFNHRPARRTNKVEWIDLEGNTVDYDVVFELGGSDHEIGSIVAAFETFWRRGARHSKDKARDDSGKLGAIRDTYPTARMLSIYAAGDFTQPARDLVKSKGIELFYINKQTVLDVWAENGVVIDYKDKAPEEEKAVLARLATEALENDPDLPDKVAASLWKKLGPIEKTRVIDSVRARLSAIPRCYAIDVVDFVHYDFDTRSELQDFLDAGEPKELRDETSQREYRYLVEFGDGDVFERPSLSWEQLSELHENLGRLVSHMEALVARQPND